MSRFDVRDERRGLGGGGPRATRPPRLWLLLAMLAAVLYLIWFLGRYS